VVKDGDLQTYRGLGVFGPAYRVMLENDAHAPGSVDRVLAERMVLLTPDTRDYLYRGFTPTESVYVQAARPKLEKIVGDLWADTRSDEDIVSAVCRFGAGLGERAARDIDAMRIGGTEEEIIERGSDWCTDVARVACVLCQVGGIASRIVHLADTERAYCGHAIIEARRAGSWGAADPTANVVYRHRDGTPASTWDLRSDPDLVMAHSRGDSTPYTVPDQFRAAAISNYLVNDSRGYDYTVSGVNDHYRSILEMADRGWPGGLRWLHGEDADLR